MTQRYDWIDLKKMSNADQRTVISGDVPWWFRLINRVDHTLEKYGSSLGIIADQIHFGRVLITTSIFTILGLIVLAWGFLPTPKDQSNLLVKPDTMIVDLDARTGFNIITNYQEKDVYSTIHAKDINELLQLSPESPLCQECTTIPDKFFEIRHGGFLIYPRDSVHLYYDHRDRPWSFNTHNNFCIQEYGDCGYKWEFGQLKTGWALSFCIQGEGRKTRVAVQLIERNGRYYIVSLVTKVSGKDCRFVLGMPIINENGQLIGVVSYLDGSLPEVLPAEIIEKNIDRFWTY